MNIFGIVNYTNSFTSYDIKMQRLLIIATRLMLLIFILNGIPEYGFAKNKSYEHFQIERLDKNVFAAIAKKGSYAICNAAIINLGNETLIFDPFMVPEAAQELLLAAEEITGNKVGYVVNSHYHNDHIGGNQVFSSARSITTYKTWDLIQKNQPAEIESYKNKAALVLNHFKNADTRMSNHHDKVENEMMKGYFEAQVRAADQIRIVTPDTLFNDHLVIQGLTERVELIEFSGGHTESDIILYLPERKIAFLGDLLFIDHHPWIGDGDIHKWEQHLDTLMQFNFMTAVPGHGDVGNKKSLVVLKEYLNNLQISADKLKEKADTSVGQSSIPMSESYSKWYLSSFYPQNIQYLLRQKTVK